ncbi:hypothetical protein KCU65_g6278, partial [Aureobasidium melanogenum]
MNYTSLINAIISATGILLSLVTRFIRTFRRTDDIATSIRRRSSRRYRATLEKCYGWILDREKKGFVLSGSLTRTIVFQPALALFVLLKAIVDIYTSIFWEIVWIVYAMAWGLANLINKGQFLTSVDPRTVDADQEAHPDHINPANTDWSFGQILAIFLLIAPLLTVSELLWPAKETEPSILIEDSAPAQDVDDGLPDVAVDEASPYTASFSHQTHSLSLQHRRRRQKKRYKMENKTYSSRDSHVVTHRSTNLPFNCLCMAERTGCPVFS